MESENIAVTITTTQQIGIETWRDINKTKVFHISCTIHEIINWAKTHDKTATFSSLQFSDVDK